MATKNQGTNVHLGMRWSPAFFDPRSILNKMHDAALDWADDAATEVQLRAQEKIGIETPGVKRRRPRPPGSPPRSPTGRLFRSIVGRLLFNIRLQDRFLVTHIVGPARSLVGFAGEEHETGERIRKRALPRRPVMGPTVEEVGPSTMGFWRNVIE